MMKVILLSVIVMLTSIVSNSVYAEELSNVWDDSCNCYLPKKIKTVSPKNTQQINRQETINTLNEMSRKQRIRDAEDVRKLNPNFDRLNKKKGQKWDVVPYPSYCVGYATVKLEQHKNQYYKDMVEYYDSKVSDTDMMSTKVDREDFMLGYDMKDDKKTLGCVEAYDKARGLE